MASMELVQLVPTGKVARELATQVARVMTDGSTTQGRERVQAFFAVCKGHVIAQDSAGFVSAVLTAAAEDLMAFPKRRVVEDIFSVLVSMLNSARSSQNIQPALQQLVEVVTSSTTDKTESRLLILGTCFNMFSERATRYNLFMQLIQYAAATNQVALVKPYFADAQAWAKAWQLPVDLTRSMYTLVASVLDDVGDIAGAQAFRVKLLESYEEASAEELASDNAVSTAVKAIIGFVKTPAESAGKKHLIDMAAVRQLRDSADHGRLFRLLNIFATEKVDAYMAYRADNAEYMDSLGLDHEASLETIRLFSLCSLAAESADGSIDYPTIAATLQVDEEDAEVWVLTAVRAGLITGRMDQLEATVHVSGFKRRVFARDAWLEIQAKLHSWRASVGDLLATLRARAPRGEASRSVLRQ